MKKFCSILFTLLVVACGKNDPAGKSSEEDYSVYTDQAKSALSADQVAMMSPLNAFSFEFFQDAHQTFPAKGFCCSPLSAAYLLGLLGEGADGNTSKEIYETLGIADRAAFNQLCLNLMTIIGEKDPKVEVCLANTGVVDNGFPLKESYRKEVKGWFDADIANMDFAEGEKVVSYVNGWASRKTRGMIDRLLDNVGPNDIAYFLNALYLKGGWSMPFDKNATIDRPFYDGAGKQVGTVKMMCQTASFPYVENSLFRMVRIPIASGNFSLDILLPAGSSDLFSGLDAAGWKQAVSGLSDSEVRLSLPRFETEFFESIKGILAGMGIKEAFGSADFSRMSASGVKVSDIKQKARIRVDESGVEAAAVTISIMDGALPGEGQPIEFSADRPFVYILSEKSTGAILFAGQFFGVE